MVLWFYVQEHPKAQPVVVLILKRLRRWGHSLKSHRTDWEKPGIKPATPGLQDIGLSTTPQRLLKFKTHHLQMFNGTLRVRIFKNIKNHIIDSFCGT